MENQLSVVACRIWIGCSRSGCLSLAKTMESTWYVLFVCLFGYSFLFRHLCFAPFQLCEGLFWEEGESDILKMTYEIALSDSR